VYGRLVADLTARNVALGLVGLTNEVAECVVEQLPSSLHNPEDFSTEVAAGLLVRARGLAEATCHLMDNGHPLEALVLARSLSDFAITFVWLTSGDRLERYRRFALADLANRLKFETLPAEQRDLYETTQKFMSAKLPAKTPGYPNLRQRAEQVGLERQYHEVFRRESQRAAHPTLDAAEHVVGPNEEGTGIVVYSGLAPGRLHGDPYGITADSLHSMLEAALRLVSSPDLAARVGQVWQPLASET
jgi:hypothetical protein